MLTLDDGRRINQVPNAELAHEVLVDFREGDLGRDPALPPLLTRLLLCAHSHRHRTQVNSGSGTPGRVNLSAGSRRDHVHYVMYVGLFSGSNSKAQCISISCSETIQNTFL
jgi:hypothetical protein